MNASPVAIDWQAALSEHDRWLRTAVYARLRDADAVEEVMQETALAAVKQQAPLADPAKVAPWLYRLAVRQALLHRRKAGRRRNLNERYVQKHPDAADGQDRGEPLDWLLAQERRSLVRTALERLPRRDAEILLLKYSEDWSYQQIANHLGATPQAVQARLHRARAKLRSELSETYES